MSDLFTIGSSGVSAYQRALGVVSNNIANVSTDGYSRQNVSLVSNNMTQQGAIFLGTGARFDSVRRQYNAFVDSNMRNAQSDLSAQEPVLNYTNRLIDIMGDKSIGLTSSMNQFFESARNLATDPASLVVRGTFLRDADGLASRFRQMASQMDLIDSETRQSLSLNVDEVNSYTKQLAYLNSQLTKASLESKQPAELLDQRDNLLSKLSQLTSFNTKFATNGLVLVSIGDTISQGVLVDGSKSRDMRVVNSPADPNKVVFLVDPTGAKETVSSITRGTLGGLVNFREQVLMPSRDAVDNLAQQMVTNINELHHNGLDLNGLLGGDMFKIDPAVGAGAAGVTMVLADATKIAAAGAFRAADNFLNTSGAQTKISYTPPTYTAPPALEAALDSGMSNDYLTAVPLTAAVEAKPIGSIPSGQSDVTVYLDNAQPGQWLQVMTRDGRQLAGSSLTSAQATTLMSSAFGMEAGATFDATYLNAAQGQGYLGMDVFIGARGELRQTQQFDTSNGAVLAPKIESAELVADYAPTFDSTTTFASGTFTLNGHSMPSITGDGSATAVINWVNAETANTGVSAALVNGKMVLSTADTTDTTSDIRLQLGTGSPADLATLGFRTGIHVVGQVTDDLVFSASDFTNAGTNTSPQILADYTTMGDTSAAAKAILRERQLQVEFTSPTQYKITDMATGDVMATRAYNNTNPGEQILFRGLTLTLTSPPATGDKFNIDGNQDGVGNNEAMLAIANLEDDSTLMGNGLTMTEAYIERVNNVGSVARQVGIAQQALQVVHDQAVQTKDGVSGVSLDQEAADLVRYQQAYQANAKVMQVGSTLFDAILQVR